VSPNPPPPPPPRQHPRRVVEAANYVPLDRLAISPQCGFASTHEGNRLSPDDQRRKLELVADTARAIWG
jgi:5-methyltetrahydropteroyltriglutamate--homocysteine methyltransferase